MKRLVIAVLFFSLSAFQTAPKCKGVKKDNTPCRSVIVSKSGYCGHHNPNATRCGHVNDKTKKPCKVVVKQGQKCRFHK